MKLSNKILKYCAIFGPGLIVAEADNDCGAVTTYIQSGAQYGHALLWLILLLLPVTYFCQEMVARLGCVTGESLINIIYKKYGKFWGNTSYVNLMLVNFLTLITEFAGITLAAQIFGISSIYAVGLIILTAIFIATTGSYKKWENIMICLCLFDITWFFIAYLTHPTGIIIIPKIPHNHLIDYLYLCMAIIGTTIAPWQLFFQQSCIVDKKLQQKDLNYERLDTFIGAFFTVLVGAAMMMVGAFAFQHNLNWINPAKTSIDLLPYLGFLFKNLIMIMIVNASLLGLCAISLTCAYTYGERKGISCTLQKKPQDEPIFYGSYLFFVLLAGCICVLPNVPLEKIIIAVQVLACMMLPYLLVILQNLLNDKNILGDYVNKTWNHIVNWIIIFILSLLSFGLIFQVILPVFHK